MIGKAQLEQMKSVAITQVDRSALVDIRNIHIDGSAPAAEKMQSCLAQIGNPYCFLFIRPSNSLLVLFSLSLLVCFNIVCRCSSSTISLTSCFFTS